MAPGAQALLDLIAARGPYGDRTLLAVEVPARPHVRASLFVWLYGSPAACVEVREGDELSWWTLPEGLRVKSDRGRWVPTSGVERADYAQRA